MADARQRDDWLHTSAVLAMLVNVNRAKGRPVQPSQFNPFVARRRKVSKRIGFRMLRDVFVRDQPEGEPKEKE